MKLKIKNKLPLIRTVAVLLVLLTVMGVVTYSWTMGIEELSINTGLKTASIPSSVNDVISLDGTEEQEIDLTDFDQLSHDGMYFSEVTSTDGVNFKIPSGGETFRDANTNDVGEKFIKFDFCVMPVDKCSLRFAEIPTFTVTDSHGATVTDADTSGFRIMIGEVEGNTEEIITSKIFTTGADTNGAKQLSTFGTNQDILSFDDQYYPSQHYLIISVWLDGNYTDSTDNLVGNKVKLNLKLKAYSDTKKTTIYFEERSGFDVGNGYYTWICNSDKSAGYVIYTTVKDPGDQIFYDSESGCYKYSFFTSDDGNFDVYVSNLAGNVSSVLGVGEIGGTYLFTANNTLEKLGSNEFVVSARVGDGLGTVYIGQEGTTSVKASYSSLQIYAIPADGYRFAGWYSDPECTSGYISGLQKYTFTATPYYHKVFYAKFEPAPTYNITFKAVTYQGGTGYVSNYSGGKIVINSTEYTADTTVQVQDTYSFSATASNNTNYTFKGWYTDSACTQLANSYQTISDTPTDSITYYAKFVKKEITVYFTNVNSWSSVYCHYWGGSEASTWPGKAMTYHRTNDINSGQKIYKTTIPYDTTGIVFNAGNTTGDNSLQTVDITDGNIIDGYCYYLTGSTNSEGKQNYDKTLEE